MKSIWTKLGFCIGALVAGTLAATCVNFVGEAQAQTGSCNGISCTGNVKDLVIWGDSGGSDYNVQIDSAAPGFCDLTANGEWVSPSSATNQLKSLLAAQLAGKQVQLRYDANQPSNPSTGKPPCVVSYVRLK